MSTPTEPPHSRNWVELPVDVTSTILSKVGAIDILTSAQYVCSSWLKICKEPSIWRSIDMSDIGDICDIDYDLKKICLHAVDRSNGELASINIKYFATGLLLKSIADRANCLRHLKLAHCYIISHSILSAAKLPFLEELELSHCSFPKEVLKAFGFSCPLLKSLKLSSPNSRIKRDEHALVIAENMPGLQKICLGCAISSLLKII